MNRTAVGIALVALCACIEGLAQVSFKLSRRHEDQRLVWTVIGGVAYVLEISLYTLALRQIDVSVAFVMGALSFVAVALLSRLVLGEKISGVRGIGLLLILAGVAVMGDQA